MATDMKKPIRAPAIGFEMLWAHVLGVWAQADESLVGRCAQSDCIQFESGTR